MKALKNFFCAIFAVAMIFGAVSCKPNEDDENKIEDEESNPPMEAETLADCKLWSQVIFEGQEYDVVKNSFVEDREPTKAEKAKLTVRYENDVILNKFIRENLNIENYVLLFWRNTKKDKSEQTGDIYLNDIYYVLNEKAEKIAIANWHFAPVYVPTEYSNPKVFEDLEAEFIRKNIDCRFISITDYANKMKHQVIYHKNSDGTANYNMIYSDKSFSGEIERTPGKLVYMTGLNIDNTNADGSLYQKTYYLNDPIHGSRIIQFFEYPKKVDNYIRVVGDGQINGNVNVNVYNSSVLLNKVTQTEIKFTIYLRKTSDGTASGDDIRNIYDITYYHKVGKLQVNLKNKTGSQSTTLTPPITEDTENPWVAYNALTSNNHVYEGISLKDTIVLSEETMTVDDLVLPKTITTTAPYRDRNAPLQKYATITYTLSATEKDGDGNPLYVPDIESYLNKYKADYEQLYQEYKSENP